MPRRVVTLQEAGEDALIERIHRILGDPPPGVLGIGDDAAWIPEARRGTLLTVDALMEGTHFRRSWMSPEDAGWKAVAVNASDIAAMGGAPTVGVLALGLPRNLPLDAVLRLARGVRRASRRFGLRVVGGNVTRSRSLSITVTLLGTPPASGPRRRATARPGDWVFVSGDPGLAGLGLRWLETNRRSGDAWTSRERGARPPKELAGAVRRLLRPEPRLGLARALDPFKPTACMDLSDGLAQDLPRFAGAFAVAVENLPVTARLRRTARAAGIAPESAVWRGGEDYELLFTVSPAAGRKLADAGRLGGVALHRLGTAEAGSGLRLAPGISAPQGGFRTFGGAG